MTHAPKITCVEYTPALHKAIVEAQHWLEFSPTSVSFLRIAMKNLLDALPDTEGQKL
jgi:hypothetical protein